MNSRNWLDLSRKLVDQFDLNYTVGAISSALGEASLSFFGEGVLSTTTYPNPFPISLSGSVLGGSVGNGIAYDPNGQITRIDPGADESNAWLCTPADLVNNRWDLLVMEYQQVGDTPVPKPSDPITTIDLNLHDDFLIKVIPGTASPTPSYPSKGATDIILGGLRVPPNATLGSQITVDLSVRELANPDTVKLPSFVSEQPSGIVNGVNNVFNLSQLPVSPSSVIIFKDRGALPTNKWSIIGQQVTLVDTPQTGQSLWVFYVEQQVSSQNPLAMTQEMPQGAVNGVNTLFTLSGNPPNQSGMLLFLDRSFVPNNQWSFVQGTPNQIQFNTAPQTGQVPYVAYFNNVASAVGTPVVGGQNLGSGTGLYSGLASSLLQFKSLTAGTGIGISDDGHGNVTVAATSTGGALLVSGYPTPVTVTPSVGVPIQAAQRQSVYVKSSGGGQTVTASPQIAAGTIVGQELFILGTSASNYPILNDGTGLSLNGQCNLNNTQCLSLEWNGSVWFEKARRQ